MHFFPFLSTVVLAIAHVCLDGGQIPSLTYHGGTLRQEAPVATTAKPVKPPNAATGPAGNPMGEIAKALMDEAKKLLAPLTTVAVSRLQSEIFGNASARGARTTDVFVFNASNRTLSLNRNKCDDGGFSSYLFPEDELAAHSSEVFGTESHGFGHGLTCEVHYCIGLTQNCVKLVVRNGYVGKNWGDFRCSGHFMVRMVSGTGNNNQVRFIIKDNPVWKDEYERN